MSRRKHVRWRHSAVNVSAVSRAAPQLSAQLGVTHSWRAAHAKPLAVRRTAYAVYNQSTCKCRARVKQGRDVLLLVQ